MRVVRLDPPPRFLSFGVLTPAGEGAACLVPRAGDVAPRRPDAAGVTIDLANLCGGSAQPFRRMDRYGALGYAAAHRALEGVEAVPRRAPRLETPVAGEEVDPEWGVMIGSSLACGASILRHDRDLRNGPVAGLSPAVFVRTVANAVNGDISIGRGLGGPSETFVSGWTAGAEALAAAAGALLEGRAKRILAGAVEAPAITPREALASRPPAPGQERLAGPLVEAAAVALLGSEPDARDEAECLGLRATLRGHDPDGRFSLAATLDALGPIPVGMIVIANTLPPDLAQRITSEAGKRPVVVLPRAFGEMGAAGAVVAVALAEVLERRAGGSVACPPGWEAPGGILVIARDPRGGTAALAVSP